MKSKPKSEDQKPLTEQQIQERVEIQKVYAGYLDGPHVIMVQGAQNPIGVVFYLSDASMIVKDYLKSKVKYKKLLQGIEVTWDSPDMVYQVILDNSEFEFTLVAIPMVERACMKNPDYKSLEFFITQFMHEKSEWLIAIGSKDSKTYKAVSRIYAPVNPEGLLTLLATVIKSVSDQKNISVNDLFTKLRYILQGIKVVKKESNIPIQ